MSERILSVDIDGVMTCGRNLAGRFTVQAMDAVAALYHDGWKMLLHSTWRCDPELLTEAESLFAERGVKLVGVTNPSEPSKAAAIAEWMTDRYGEHWPRVVVVDDDEITLPGATVVRIDFREGLTLAALRAHGIEVTPE